MSQPLFSAEELAELAVFDAEIDDDDELTLEEYKASAEFDQEAKFSAKDKRSQQLAAKQRAYYEANKEELAAKQRAYREANKEELAAKKRAYYEANKEEMRKYNREYMREYRRRKKENAATLIGSSGMV